MLCYCDHASTYAATARPSANHELCRPVEWAEGMGAAAWPSATVTITVTVTVATISTSTVWPSITITVAASTTPAANVTAGGGTVALSIDDVSFGGCWCW
jgi:hypothetical protein